MQFLFPKYSYEFKMAHCSDSICWYCLLAMGYTRISENLTGHRVSQLGVPIWKATHRQGTSKERTWVDVGTLRPAYSEMHPLGVCLTDTPCFYPQSQGGSIKHYGNVYKLQKGPLLCKQGWRMLV